MASNSDSSSNGGRSSSSSPLALSGLNVTLAELQSISSSEDVANNPDLIASIRSALIERNPNPDGYCPNGYICNPLSPTTEIVNCTRLRQLSVLWGLGDLHAGSWCPPGDNRYLNCPVGYYCTQPDTFALCPAGWYCPHKTSVPEIICHRCETGAMEIQRQLYGYIIFSLLLAAFVAYVIWHWIRRYRADLFRRLIDLSSRQTLDPSKLLQLRNERQALLERIRPKLYSINQRLAALHDNSQDPETIQTSDQAMTGWYKSPIFAADGKTIQFSAHKLFDMLDYNHNGYLSYDELQEILQLNPYQLQEFVKRLNELDQGGHTNNNNNNSGSAVAFHHQHQQHQHDETAVSRPCFVRHFLGVLQETQHFGPTADEVEDRWNELSRQGLDVKVTYESFYHSPLTQFLSDPQIHRLIRHFRAIQEQMYYDQQQQQRFGGEDGAGNAAGRYNNYITSFIGGGGGGGAGTTPRSRIDPHYTGGNNNYSTNDNPSQALSDTQRETTTTTTFIQQQLRDDPRRSKYITRPVFVDHYARLLAEVTSTNLDATMTLYPAATGGGGAAVGGGGDPGTFTTKPGVDITFEGLSLTVKVGEVSANVVNHVSGRMRASTMNALMGGSGCGKTSLLNALCGRAFYGTTTGKIYVNGHETSIENHRSSMGFVPQDDIVHGALTVRENLVYSGLFSLPRGTSRSNIEDLADETLANLGLTRVANSLVGDVSRRGISGGEKKRVNVGIELMKKPAILFLDEPTSGLDSSSALLVMKSLKTLVETQGVTILSVIHQPRKFIFDLFDSVILLGVGGNMVYHGPVNESEAYFAKLPESYHLPPGESVADWLIDVSSGRLEPEKDDTADSDRVQDWGTVLLDNAAVGRAGPSSNKADNAYEEAKVRRQVLYDAWKNHVTKNANVKYSLKAPTPYDLPVPVKNRSFLFQLFIQLRRNFLLAWRNRFSKFIDTAIILVAVSLISWFEGVVDVTREVDPNIPFGDLTSGDPVDLVRNFGGLFRHATNLGGLIQFSMALGVITSVLLSLMASKAITQYRHEFFREAGSGYSINAYFLAINITSFLEHSTQMVAAALSAFWFRDSIASFVSYLVHFLALSWTCVSWGLLVPVIVPPENVVLVVGFAQSFFGLLFSGVLPPVEFETLYSVNTAALALLSGFVSPTRYFVEGLVVHEQRCLPYQSGFTVEPYAVNFPLEFAVSTRAHLGQHDRGVVQHSCNGWYWGILPALVVGVTIRFLAMGAIHSFYRSKQAKKPYLSDLSQRPLSRNRTFLILIAYIILFLELFALASWLILGTRGETGIWDPAADPAFNVTLTQDVVNYYGFLFP